MANKIVDADMLDNGLTAIADSIREKTGEQGAFAFPDGFVDAVAQIPQGDNYYDTFWDTFQMGGERKDYSNVFVGGYSNEAHQYYWSRETFKPKYDMRPTNALQMFQNFRFVEDGVLVRDFDLEQHLKDCGIVFDTSNATSLDRGFAGSCVDVIPVVDTRSTTRPAGIFYGATCTTIRKIIIDETVTPNQNNFQACVNLVNVEIEGTIATTVNFASCKKLSAISAQSIMNALANFAGTENEFVNSVVWSAETKEMLDALGATSPHGNTWREYAADKGWNN